MSINEHHIHGDYIYAITFSTHERKRIFSDKTNALIMTNCILTGRALHHYWLLGYVVMPDHVHIIIKAKGKTISDCVGFLKGSSARMLNQIAGKSGQLWQRRYFSRPIVKIGLLIKEIEYIEGNPVKDGLDDYPLEYLFSSAGIRELLDIGMTDEPAFWEEPETEDCYENH